MQAVIDSILYLKDIFQSYSSLYSCTYSATLLLFALWLLPEKNKGEKKLYRYAMALFLSILLVTLIALIYQSLTAKEFITNLPDLYMLFPALLLFILMFADVGWDLKITHPKVALAFLIIILCEASVPLRISVLNSFAAPASDGKYSADIKQIIAITKDESILLPMQMEYEYYSYCVEHNLPPTYELYDGEETYLTYEDCVSLFKQARDSGSCYIALRIKKMVGYSDLDVIIETGPIYGYEYIKTIGDYALMKKE